MAPVTPVQSSFGSGMPLHRGSVNVPEVVVVLVTDVVVIEVTIVVVEVRVTVEVVSVVVAAAQAVI